jgi:hypothetical protein
VRRARFGLGLLHADSRAQSAAYVPSRRPASAPARRSDALLILRAAAP